MSKRMTVTTAETSSEPRQPRRFEKNRNNLLVALAVLGIGVAAAGLR
jgi:hypothetical protein